LTKVFEGCILGLSEIEKRIFCFFEEKTFHTAGTLGAINTKKETQK
jgi:hypothetical protein